MTPHAPYVGSALGFGTKRMCMYYPGEDDVDLKHLLSKQCHFGGTQSLSGSLAPFHRQLSREPNAVRGPERNRSVVLLLMISACYSGFGKACFTAGTLTNNDATKLQ